MIVDSSALIAILKKEDDHDRITDTLLLADSPHMISSGTWLETCIVSLAYNPEGFSKIDGIRQEFGLIIEPVTESQILVAREAFLKYGRGRHKAKLNFGDCFSYALAKDKNLPLLAKGDDFSHTDLTIADL